jgi:uncharacterized ion transporter superfamily protein YfcC
MSEQSSSSLRRGTLNPILILLGLLVVAVVLTHLLPAGRFERHDDTVVPGSYRAIEKLGGLPALLATATPQPTDEPARAGGLVSLFAAIPAGMIRASSLIFMVMFIGGMFGVVRATGALDAGVDRLLYLTSGNIYVLTAGLMVLLACGSSFIGLISEYVAIIPLVMVVGDRLGLPKLFAPAVVGVAAKIGYAASVANPVALAAAQPLAGVPVFSGILPRLAIFAVMLVLGIGYVLMYLRRVPRTLSEPPVANRLSLSHVAVLLCLLVGAGILITGARLWEWHSTEIGAFFIALSIILAFLGRLRATPAADAFLEGMKSTLLASLLIGLAGAVAIILQASQVLDSVVQALTLLVQDHVPSVVASALMIIEMVLDFLVPSLAAKAAISMPILAPIAHLSGVSGQVTVTALLLGSGLNHLISPTSAVLLAFLSLSKVSYGEWLRFIAPLWATLCGVGFAALILMTLLGA